MAKFKPSKITKYDASGERYVFIGGKAKVPGFKLSGKPVFITMKEFKESTSD